MEKQQFLYDDFYVEIWGNISSNIVSEEYVFSNKDFINSITFDFYRLYSLDEKLTLVIIRRMVESFFFNMSIFKPQS